jgi:hypothetical protein
MYMFAVRRFDMTLLVYFVAYKIYAKKYFNFLVYLQFSKVYNAESG